MSCLDATFTLTPKAPSYSDAGSHAVLYCFGADFWTGSPYDFDGLHTGDQFFFDGAFAADANLDYAQWSNLKRVRYLQLYLNLAAYGTQKQLALIFGFEAPWQAGRVLVYSNAGLLHDQTLAVGDSQFLLEIEALDLPLSLQFIHAGGSWLFKGLSGYVI